MPQRTFKVKHLNYFVLHVNLFWGTELSHNCTEADSRNTTKAFTCNGILPDVSRIEFVDEATGLIRNVSVQSVSGVRSIKLFSFSNFIVWRAGDYQVFTTNASSPVIVSSTVSTDLTPLNESFPVTSSDRSDKNTNCFAPTNAFGSSQSSRTEIKTKDVLWTIGMAMISALAIFFVVMLMIQYVDE